MLAGLTTTMVIMIDADDSNERQPGYLAEIRGVYIYPPSQRLWSLTQDYNRWLKRRVIHCIRYPLVHFSRIADRTK